MMGRRAMVSIRPSQAPDAVDLGDRWAETGRAVRRPGMPHCVWHSDSPAAVYTRRSGRLGSGWQSERLSVC